jgi:hypothetical protein
MSAMQSSGLRKLPCNMNRNKKPAGSNHYRQASLQPSDE